MLKKILIISLLMSAMGCQHASLTPTTSSITVYPQAAESVLLLSGNKLSAVDHLIAHSTLQQGMVVYDRQKQALYQREGAFESLDGRAYEGYWLLTALNKTTQQAEFFTLDQQGFGQVTALPKRDFSIEATCLYTDKLNNNFAFLVGEEGIGEQWLVGTYGKPLAVPQQVRRLSLPPEASSCSVNDRQHQLIVNDETLGLWQYDAKDEAPLVRKVIDLIKPFGTLKESVGGVVAQGDWLASVDPEARELRFSRWHNGSYILEQVVSLPHLDEPKKLSLRVNANSLDIWVVHEQGIDAIELPIKHYPESNVNDGHIKIIAALVQTDSVPSVGDAADDPAIWVHPHDPAQSLILGTDKKGGLGIYDLSGKQVNYLPVGRLNNVDVRQKVKLGDHLLDIAAATHRDNYSVQIYSLDSTTGQASVLGEIITPLKDIYGFCLYKDEANQVYAIPNDADGTFIQYHLSLDQQNHLHGKEVRRWKTATQPEGCVADDQRHRLFIGEEDVGVWTLDARADSVANLELILTIGEWLKDDVEGLAIYQAETPYLVISSQGNDSYVVADAIAPYKIHGAFRVGINAEAGIDGVSETDGLEVSSIDLGGVWNKGILLLQDGRKRLPETNQNFKYVPWSAVKEALELK